MKTILLLSLTLVLTFILSACTAAPQQGKVETVTPTTQTDTTFTMEFDDTTSLDPKQTCLSECLVNWKADPINATRDPRQMDRDCNGLCNAAQAQN